MRLVSMRPVQVMVERSRGTESLFPSQEAQDVFSFKVAAAPVLVHCIISLLSGKRPDGMG